MNKRIFESFTDYYEGIINEGVYDRGIFKAFYLAGGSGSGKSFVITNTIDGIGLKTVNSDILFEFLLDKHEISKKIKDLPPHEFERAMELRNKAKILTEKQFNLYLDGRLGLVIDGTGHDFNKIKNSSEKLKELGYDTYMVFVNTSLEIAIERNLQRNRSLSIELITQNWKDVQANIGKFQDYFGQKNFIIIDNNNADEDIFLNSFKRIQKLVNNPIDNYIAKQWIDKEIELRKTK